MRYIGLCAMVVFITGVGTVFLYAIVRVSCRCYSVLGGQ